MRRNNVIAGLVLTAGALAAFATPASAGQWHPNPGCARDISSATTQLGLLDYNLEVLHFTHYTTPADLVSGQIDDTVTATNTTNCAPLARVQVLFRAAEAKLHDGLAIARAGGSDAAIVEQTNQAIALYDRAEAIAG
ncbi:hypothetical protein [Umezawaea sp. NPDC059074]|uniref:hypothetical protein n=1 Tax=Umezawaea sp. NPDC059074 TaxID=3346716 RepID=UPI003682E873